MFGAARVYPRPMTRELQDIMNALGAEVSCQRYAIYTQNMVVVASDQYWQLPKRDLHALDLLVRHNEAPFTDQIFRRDDGSNECALIFTITKDLKFVCVHGLGTVITTIADTTLPKIVRQHEVFWKEVEPAPPIVNRQDGIVAWCVHDLVTHRWFGDVPDEYEQRFVAMIAKCYEIADENVAPTESHAAEQGVRETVHVNRVKDISFRLQDHMFFYMPQVLIKDTSMWKDPNLWSIFLMHDLKSDIPKMREFSQRTMLSLLRYIKPINPVAPYISDILNRA
jgi:hypothetical protein